jgi:hypothetical protein
MPLSFLQFVVCTRGCQHSLIIRPESSPHIFHWFRIHFIPWDNITLSRLAKQVRDRERERESESESQAIQPLESIALYAPLQHRPFAFFENISAKKAANRVRVSRVRNEYEERRMLWEEIWFRIEIKSHFVGDAHFLARPPLLPYQRKRLDVKPEGTVWRELETNKPPSPHL